MLAGVLLAAAGAIILFQADKPLWALGVIAIVIWSVVEGRRERRELIKFKAEMDGDTHAD
jgi:hypothetical protein